MFASTILPLATLSLYLAAPSYAYPGSSGASLQKRTFDTCAYLNSDLKASSSLISSLGLGSFGVGAGISFGTFDSAFCLNDLDSFCKTDVVAKACVKAIGTAKTKEWIKDIFSRSSSKKQCSYPEHAVPKCSKDRVCNFECCSGFSVSYDSSNNPQDCVCRGEGKSVCNGVCGDFKSCSTAAPKRRGLDARADVKRTCQSGWEACPVPNSGPDTWECVNVQTDLESCGGCVGSAFPSTLVESVESRGTGLGTDCTALEGVADVACLQGACVVSKCVNGYTVAQNGEECVRS